MCAPPPTFSVLAVRCLPLAAKLTGWSACAAWAVELAVQGFLGVPFAAPPLRFAPAADHPPWTSPRDATAVGARCLQGAHAGSEDCLFLNVFRRGPSGSSNDSSAAAAPVLVEIHGGGFQSGGASQLWNLTRLTGVVAVSIQYRLNVLGFFSTSSVPPVLGLQDQRQALRWVRDNAAAFGGDQNRVMIYGSSAGGASVAGHMVLPESVGLFHAAAIESPGGHQVRIQTN